MNEYDSDKMADVLNASEAIVKTDNPEEADIILFNTCSVREKAQECEPVDDARQGRFGCRPIGIAPGRHGQHGEQDDDQETRQLFHAPPARRAAILGAAQQGVRIGGCRVLATIGRLHPLPHHHDAFLPGINTLRRGRDAGILAGRTLRKALGPGCNSSQAARHSMP